MIHAALSPSQVERLLAHLVAHLDTSRLDQLRAIVANLSVDSHRARVADMHRLLFSGKPVENANRSLNRLIVELAEAATGAGIALALCITKAKSVGAEQRELWFEGETLSLQDMIVTEELDRVGSDLIEDTRGQPVGLVEPRLRLSERRAGKPVVRVFLSYAHDDAQPTKKLERELLARLRISSKYAFELWKDELILVGEDWDAKIHEALTQAHLGVLLLSPHFLASKYIRDVELPALVTGRSPGAEGKRVVPVELRKIDFEHMDMHGLQQKQVFRGPFPTRAGPKCDEWVTALVKQIHKLLDKYASIDPVPPPSSPPRGGGGRPRAQQMIGAELDGVERLLADGVLIDDACGRPARLDASVLDAKLQAGTRDSVQALDYILDWLRVPGDPSLFAVLGEYGMGKTVTCQRVVRAIEDTEGEALPSPLYFDLRVLTSLREHGRVPTLDEVIDECIARGWRPVGDKPTAAMLLERARREPMVFVFDGLDEALVHLSEANGKVFTRELLRVRQLGAATRVLISCRTHYFRTLQEQDAHFTGQDRGGTTAADYRALVLLPLADAQIRSYLARAIPGLDVEKAIDLVRNVHDLSELAGRPYTLRLIGEQVPAIEQLRAQGRPVYGVTLYRLMVDKWLTRDGGKHHLKPDHKRKLMSHLAARTWARGIRLVPAAELDAWFGAWLDGDPVLERRYRATDFDKLEEDLRTATFLVREDDEAGKTSGFRFAHSSMQEFFMASHLFEALDEDAPERWEFERISPEIWEFFGQYLQEGAREDLVRRMSTWAVGEHRAARHMVFRYVIAGHRKGWPLPSVVGSDLSGIDLQGVVLRGPMDLSRTRWEGANLRQVDWSGIDLTGACFDRADLRFGVVWGDVRANGASFADVCMDGATFRRVVWEGASWKGASGSRCNLIHTQMPGFELERPRVAPGGGAAERAVQVGELPLGFVQSCAWSPDGLHALLGCDDGTVRLWDVASGSCLAVWTGHSGAVTSCAWSPDGTRALSAGDDGTMRVWDVASGSCLAVWTGYSSMVMSCGWSPDGTRALSAGFDKTVRLWDVASGSCLAVWTGHSNIVISCAWSPDGTRALSAGHDSTVRLWDVASGSCLAVWTGHSIVVTWCAWSPDCTRALSTGYDNTVRLWDVASGSCLAVWTGHSEWVMSCVWSPDGTRALSAGLDNTVRLWDVASGSCLAVWTGHSNIVISCAWSPDGTRALSAGHDSTVRLWDVASGSCLAVWTGHSDIVMSCAWSPDGTRALSAGYDSTVRLWDVASGSCLAVWTGHSDIATSCAWSPDGTCALSTGDDSTVRLWDVASGSCLAVWTGHSNIVISCAWSPDGTRALSAGHDSTVRLWDVASGSCLAVWTGHSDIVMSCAWSPDGTRALSAGYDSTVRLWDVASGSCLAVWTGHSDIATSCAWSPDGTCALSTGDDSTVRLWDVASGSCLAVWTGHSNIVISCAWSPDGTRALSAGGDNTMRLWDVASGSCLAVWTGHSDIVMSCAWSPDGTRALSAGYDSTLRLWDVASGACLSVWTGHAARRFESCAWSPDGTRILCTGGGSAGIIEVRDANTGDIEFVFATTSDSHASFTPTPPCIIEASKHAWRWLRWQVLYDDGTIDVVPAETFGELPPAKLG